MLSFATLTEEEQTIQHLEKMYEEIETIMINADGTEEELDELYDELYEQYNIAELEKIVQSGNN